MTALHGQILLQSSMLSSLKATVENPRGSVEKMLSVEGGDTTLRGSLRAPERFSKGKPEASKPRGRRPRGSAGEGLPQGFSTDYYTVL